MCVFEGVWKSIPLLRTFISFVGCKVSKRSSFGINTVIILRFLQITTKSVFSHQFFFFFVCLNRRAHTLTVLFILTCALVYVTLLEETPQDTTYNTKRYVDTPPHEPCKMCVCVNTNPVRVICLNT